MASHPTAREWFDQGRRVLYDSDAREIVEPADSRVDRQMLLSVFERVVTVSEGSGDARWTTLLPGFPDGSYGWSKVDTCLHVSPRLYVEYVGQGDSDKPEGYVYSTMERSDLVEAQWRAHGVRSTVVVTFDYSSLVVLELLQRQLERTESGNPLPTRIERVLSINGGYFADAHSHPWTTTPLLKTPVGKLGTWVAQRSRFAFDRMMEPLFSKEYGVSRGELGEIFDAITRRNGAAFMSNAAGFVDEHKRNAHRWDLRRIFLAARDKVSFHLVGSEEDQFEPNQILKVCERLGDDVIDIRMLPGGHMSTSEQAEALAEMIHELAGAEQLRADNNVGWT